MDFFWSMLVLIVLACLGVKKCLRLVPGGVKEAGKNAALRGVKSWWK